MRRPQTENSDHMPAENQSNLSPASSPRKNKRKSMEPRKFHLETPPTTPDEISNKRRRRLNSTGSESHGSPENSESRTPSPGCDKDKQQRLSPLHIAPKKRFKLEAMRELQRLEEKECSVSPQPSSGPVFTPNPFRPWNESSSSLDSPTAGAATPSLQPAQLATLPVLMQRLSQEMQLALLAAVSTSQPSATATPLQLAQTMPLSLALPSLLPDSLAAQPSESPLTPPVQDEPLSLVKNKSPQSKQTDSKKSPLLDPKRRVTVRKGDNVARQKAGLPPQATSESSTESVIPVKGVTLSDTSSATADTIDDRSKQRNYKNLTRARRIEANARERQRVHTITAAFDTLQAAIPTQEEKGVKLSKLSVIKIATAYIMALSRMAGYDYTEDQSAPSLHQVIQQYHQTVSEETKVKCRKS